MSETSNNNNKDKVKTQIKEAETSNPIKIIDNHPNSNNNQTKPRKKLNQ